MSLPITICPFCTTFNVSLVGKGEQAKRNKKKLCPFLGFCSSQRLLH